MRLLLTLWYTKLVVAHVQQSVGLTPHDRLRHVAEGVLHSVLAASDARVAANPTILAASEQLIEDFLMQTDRDGLTESILDMSMFHVRFLVTHYVSAWRTGYLRGFMEGFQQ